MAKICKRSSADYINLICQANPVMATWLGRHDLDHTLGDRSQEALDATIAETRKLETQLESVTPTGETDSIDRNLVLWRAVRIVLDVRLHTREMAFEDAVEMLVDVAKLERPNALAEIKRYCQSATQPMSYAVGKREIQRLKSDWNTANPSGKLSDFYNQLLSFGTIPVELLRRGIGLADSN